MQTAIITDFGLCKRINRTPGLTRLRSCFEMTGNTGSARYMAPEASMNQPYDEKVTSIGSQFSLQLQESSSYNFILSKNPQELM